MRLRDKNMKPPNRESDRQDGRLGRGLNVSASPSWKRCHYGFCSVPVSFSPLQRITGGPEASTPPPVFSDHLQRSEKEFSLESSPAVMGLFLSELSDIDFVKFLLFLSLLYRLVDYPLKAARDLPHVRGSTWSSSHLFFRQNMDASLPSAPAHLHTPTSREAARAHCARGQVSGPRALVCEGRSSTVSPIWGTWTIPSGRWLLKWEAPQGPGSPWDSSRNSTELTKLSSSASSSFWGRRAGSLRGRGSPCPQDFVFRSVTSTQDCHLHKGASPPPRSVTSKQECRLLRPGASPLRWVLRGLTPRLSWGGLRGVPEGQPLVTSEQVDVWATARPVQVAGPQARGVSPWPWVFRLLREAWGRASCPAVLAV